jgi:acetyltransferase-like isoleucine patch superfamily enzyme
MARLAKDRYYGGLLSYRANTALVPPPPRAFGSFGNPTIIVPPARIEHPEFMYIGDSVLIHEHAWLLARQPSPDAPKPSLVIGNGAMLMRFMKVVCMGSITIGEGAVIGDRGYISDVEYEPGHAEIDPSARPLTVPKPVVLEPFAFLGVGVVVKPGVTIGERAYIGAGSIVTEDIPAHSLAVGAPARVVRRADASTAEGW